MQSLSYSHSAVIPSDEEHEKATRQDKRFRTTSEHLSKDYLIMSEQEKQKVADDILGRMVYACRGALWTIAGFLALQAFTLFCIAVTDHYTLQSIKSETVPHVVAMWDEHWHYAKTP